MHKDFKSNSLQYLLKNRYQIIIRMLDVNMEVAWLPQ